MPPRANKTSKRWNHSTMSLEVRAKALSKISSGDAGVSGDAGGASKVVSQDKSKFVEVMQVLAANEAFWTSMRSVKYVKMLPCVCSGVSELMRVEDRKLPYWGVWTRCMRDHGWKEIQAVMGVRKNHLKELQDVSVKLDPTNPNSPRMYSLKGVMEKMMEMNGGYAGYAKRIQAYRSNRLVEMRRRVTYAMKQAQVFGVSGLVEGKVKLQIRETKEKKEKREKEEDEKVKEEFGRALCEEGGISPESFMSIDLWDILIGGNEEEEGCCIRRWNTILRMHQQQGQSGCIEYEALGVCLGMHIPSILELLSTSTQGKRKRISIECKVSAARVHALALCRSLHVWFGGRDESVLLAGTGIADRKAYLRKLTEKHTVKGDAPIVWPDNGSCPMMKRGGMAELARAVCSPP